MKGFDLKNMIWIFLVLFMAACQDETDSRLNVEEGLPAKLALSIQVPEVDDITVTRAITENESQINQLALFFYSQNSNLSYGVDLSSMLNEGASDENGYRTYSLTGAINVKTGTFRIYAVANWSSNFSNQILNVNSVPDESELKVMMASNNFVYALNTSEYLPMSQVLTNQTFYAEGEGTNTLQLSLKRATARIEFTIKNGEELDGTFTPQSYQIYNLPSSSYLFEQDNNMVENLSIFNSEVITLEDGATAFEFLMNENVRPAGTNISQYIDRDMYNGDWMSHKFTNAPENSTYVVINGRYEGTEGSGDVHYLVHLGNFSSTGNVNNFTVNRNEYHKYTVTVNGIENISTDVEVKNPGAYGNIEIPVEFVSTPTPQDAHYVIYPIQIKAKEGWTLTSMDPNVTLRTNHTVLTRRGYWIEEDKGDASISGDASDDNITVYAFLTENAGDKTREMKLELRPANMPEATPRTFTISQLCPSWNGDLGCERIEEYDEGFDGYPWGFSWPDDMTITYNMENAELGDLIKNALLNAFLSWFTDYGSFITKETILLSITSVTINFDEIPQVNVAKDANNGRKNTSELYNFNGIEDVSTLMSVLEDWGGVAERELPLNPEEFAARACAMKNKYNKTTEVNMGQTIEIPVLAEENLVWYLPSKNEAVQMKDEGEYALHGDYWTSTAAEEVSDNVDAYKYSSETGTTELATRDQNLHVRAVRKKD